MSFDVDAEIGRFWGIPVIGHLVRALALIPHVVALYLVGIVATIIGLFTWIPVLLVGRFPGWGYTWVGGVARWSTRLSAWGWLLAGPYPPFSRFEDGDYPVRVEIDEDQRINRFWGIPLLGILVRAVILIPHYLVLWVLGLVTGILLLFSWIPVLISGTQSALVYRWLGGYLRWGLRVSTYLLLLHDRYPPFSLGDEEADRYR